MACRIVIASGAKQSKVAREALDCFAKPVIRPRSARARWLAMTAVWWPGSNSQIPMLQLRCGHQLAGRAAPHRAAALDDVMAVADTAEMLDILFDHQDRLPARLSPRQAISN